MINYSRSNGCKSSGPEDFLRLATEIIKCRKGK